MDKLKFRTKLIKRKTSLVYLLAQIDRDFNDLTDEQNKFINSLNITSDILKSDINKLEIQIEDLTASLNND